MRPAPPPSIRRRAPLARACALLTLSIGLVAAPASACPLGSAAPGVRAPLQAPLGPGVAAVAKDLELTFAEYDEALLWRHGLTQDDGRPALRQLLELRLLRQLMAEQGLSITSERLQARWDELDRQTKAQGVAGGLKAHLASQGIPERLFMRYLELSIAQEILARRALGIPPDGPLTPEQQSSWLEGELSRRGYSEEPFPWEDGVVARCGDVTIGRRDFAAHLREQLRNKDTKKLCFDLLLRKALRARMPDLSDTAFERAIDEELDRRRRQKESDPRYKGIPYEELLKAKGLTLESMRHDPAIQCATLAKLWVDRQLELEEGTVREARLRETYEEERDYFDGRFGEAVEVYVLVLHGVERTNDVARRTLVEADIELDALAGGLQLLERSPRRVRLEDFQALVAEHSEDTSSREKNGLLARARRIDSKVPEMILREVFELLGRVRGDTRGLLLGPVQVQGASALVCLGERTPAPSWTEMSEHVHTELRRRFLTETLLPVDVTTWRD